MDGVNRFADNTNVENEEQLKLDHALCEIYKNSTRSEDLVTRLRKSLLPDSLVKTVFQENYDLY